MNNYMYLCPDCGYVYDETIGDIMGGIEPGVPFEQLPDEWCCPVCGCPKDKFLKIPLNTQPGLAF